jgi:lipopolysaccharide/colanic/teichoic acid biosynthesis glycosyltransferase
MKRLFDIVLSIFALVVFFPLLVIMTILIRRDGGPALFVQQRVGKNGEVFSMYKFRSMVVDAESLGGYSTQDKDTRITKIGRFVRKTSIDELPQLLNVLKGDMSIVGPRPNVPAQRKEYTQEQWELRNSVTPGITGLAQATLRSQATWEQRFLLDSKYVEKCGIFFDLYIILLTVKQVVFKGGN